MNLDFILFSSPKGKYSFMDFWGQTIFIPAYQAKKQIKKPFFNFANCYNAPKNSQVYFSIENALSDNQGLNQEQLTANTSNLQQLHQDQEISYYIPTLFLNSMVKSMYLVIYFHSSGEDIKLSHGLLNYIRNSFQVNVVAMEYPGYSIYQGSPDSQIINKNARITYQYCVKELGFQQSNIIVIGRSIGTGVALELLRNKNQTKTPRPRCLTLISPFCSVKQLAKEHAGSIGKFLVKEKYDNLQAISQIHCPVFILHGKKDALISHEHSQELIKNCYNRKQLLVPENMTHTSLDYYSDLVDPLREFLMEEGINFYEQNMKGPVIPESLFECPEKFKI